MLRESVSFGAILGESAHSPMCSKDPLKEQDDLLRLEQDVITSLAANRKLFVYVSRDFWRQIKTAASAIPASALYLAQFQKTSPNLLTEPGKPGSGGPTIIAPVFIDPSATVDSTAKIGPNVSLGKHAYVCTFGFINDGSFLDLIPRSFGSCGCWRSSQGCHCNGGSLC